MHIGIGVWILGGRSALWTPAALANVLWFQADAQTLSNNDLVDTLVTSKVGLPNATAAGALRPTFKTNILNGLPGILFSGGQCLQTAAVDLTAYNKVSVFLVASSNTTLIQDICDSGNLFTDAGSFGAMINADLSMQFGVLAGAFAIWKPTKPSLSTPQLIEYHHDGSLATNEITGGVNGDGLGAFLGGYNNNTTTNYGNLPFNIGARNNGALYPLTGYIHEIIVCAGGLADADKTLIRNYINTRWSLFNLGVSNYSDNAYTGYAPRVGSGIYPTTSPGARLIYQTTATQAVVDTYNNIYGAYPTMSDMGVRVGGVDNQLLEPGQIGTKQITISLPAGDKTVEFINGLGSKTGYDNIGSYVCGVEFNAPATLIAGVTTPRILVYGDSISVGANCTNPSLEGWQQLVRNVYSGSVLSEGRGYRSLYDDGTTATMRQAFADHIAAQSPSIIWLAIGVNDYQLNKWSAADFGTAYADLLDKLHVALPSVVIYAQTPILKTSEVANSFGNTLGDYRTQIATAQSSRSAYCNLVDGTAFMTTASLADGVHPTTAGHALYAAAVITALGI